MSGITAGAGATASLHQAQPRAQHVQAEGTARRTTQALAVAAGAAIKAASSAHSQTIDTYA
jgi:hypothetical protein